METFLAFLINASSDVRRSYLHGREYLVVPVTMAIPGVMSGSDGPLYYPAEELQKSVPDWNHVPIVAPKHPTVNGQPVSARDPDFLEKYGVGMILRTKFSDKLIAEAWYDVEACKRVDKRLLPLIRNGKKIEVSTGLFLQKTLVSDGISPSGTSYKYITSGYKPDHLATLLDEKGACSIDDGCGISVNSDGTVTETNSRVDNQKLSHSDIRSKLSEKLLEKFGFKEYSDGYKSANAYLMDVFDRECIYSVGDELYKMKYSSDNRTGEVSLSGDPLEVTRVTSYKPVTNVGGVVMDRDATITWLVTNCDCWKTPDGKEVLNKASDDTLKLLKARAEDNQVLVANANTAKKSFTDSLGNVHTWDETKKEWSTKQKEEKKETPVGNQVTTPNPTQSLTPEQIEDLEFARRVKTDIKTRHIGIITANTQNKFTKEQLEQFSLATLENLSALAAPPTPVQPPQFAYPSYGGAATPPVHNTQYQPSQEDMDAVAIPPVTDYSQFLNRK